MEPLAPGTEDDPLYTQVSRPSKKETVEEHTLSKKAFLPNGKYDGIFELNYIQGAQHWFCRICDCPVLGKVFNHEIGKRHTANLEKWNRTTESDGREGSNASGGSGSEAPIVVAPGEPVPPGFEGEIEKITMIQDRLDGFNAGPIVGLEYLLELLDYDPSKEPSYLCILCDKKGDPRTVLTHLSSYNHQVMYLQKHFPTVYRHIAPYMIKAFKRNWQSGLQKIAEAIEHTFGRLKPMPVEAGKFDKDRMLYIEIVAKGKHFNELSGHTFEHVVTKEDLTKVHEEPKPYDSTLPFRKTVALSIPKRKSPSPPVVARPIKRLKPPPEGGKNKKRSLSPVSDISSSDLEDFDLKGGPNMNKASKADVRRTAPPTKSTSSKRGDSWRRSPSPRRREGPMPWQKSNYGRSKPPPSATAAEKRRDEKAEKMEEFKKLSKAIDSDMEQVLKKHKQNPEKHLKYNDEWKKFWNSRYKELQTEGKNAATHDFKPEWIEFWNKRMLELHQEEIKTKKLALRKRLGLPDEATPISFKIAERRKLLDAAGRDNKPIPTAAQPDNDPEVIVIEDNDKDSVRSRSPPSKNSRRRSRSPLRKRERSPQFRRRSPAARRDSPPPRRRESPPTRRPSPPPHRPTPPVRRTSPPARRPSPPVRRPSPPVRRPSPPVRRLSPPIRRPSPPVRRPSPPIRRPSPPSHKPARRVSPPPVRRRSIEKISPTPLRASPPPRASPRRDRDDMKFSPATRRYSVERSPGPDRFGVSRNKRSKDRSRSRGRSRELSWERDRHRDYDDKHRDYDDKHSYRHYRSRGGHDPWDSPPISRERLYGPMVDPYAPPKIMRDVTREPVLYVTPAEDEDVNIVGVLRHLTALEEKLGSLGPKVIELLGQALAMEKKVANSSEGLLDSEMNCVLFETVKEKLKGQLQAGLVDRIQEKAFKTAITKTASLIHLAGERKRQKEVELPKKPVVVPGVGTVDKGKIARQIANALIAQGKTDVTQAELEQLINAVVGIAEAQKNSAQPMTTASFLEQLSNAGESVAAEKPEPVAEKPKEVVVPEKPKMVVASPKKEEERPVPQKIEEDEEEQDASNGSVDKSTMNMEGLSDSDLQTLLQNFKDLSTEEQHGLINYLKKLEAKEPERVEKLRKFVNLTETLEEKTENSGRYSPFSNRTGSVNPAPKEEETKADDDVDGDEKNDKDVVVKSSSSFVNIDSEDEEYSFEDVAKAASQKVIEKEMERKRKEEETKKESEDKNLSDAKALITSLMNSLNKGTARPPAGGSSNAAPVGGEARAAEAPVAPSVSSNASAGSANTEETKQATAQGKINIISNVPVSSADLAKSLSGITMSMSSLGSILGNVQNMTRQNQSSASAPGPEPTKVPAPDNQPDQDFPIGGGGANRPNPRNPYDEFDISSQRDVRGNPAFDDQPKNRSSKTYDEFNIGPNPGEFRDEMADPLGRSVSRGGPGYGQPQRGPGFSNKPTGYPDRGSIPQNVHDRNSQYAPSGGGFRGNATSSSLSSQYPSRGGIPSSNMRSNNFDIRGGDFGLDRGDYRGGRNESRGGMSDYRSGLNDMRGGLNDMRGEPSDMRGGPSDMRGGPSDMRGAPSDMRGAPSDMRGGTSDMRGGTSDMRGGTSDIRGGTSDMRGGTSNIRGGPSDMRSGPNDMRGGTNDMRGRSNDMRGGSNDMRGGPNDLRGGPLGDVRSGNIGDMRARTHGESRGGSHDDLRGGPHGDLRGKPHGDLRGGVHGDSRGGPYGDLRSSDDMRSEFRGGSGDYRGGSDFGSNDYRMDSRGPIGNFRGGMDDMRNSSSDARGGSGLSRAGPTSKGGMLIDPNRLGHSASSRYSGNFGGNNSSSNSYNRW